MGDSNEQVIIQITSESANTQQFGIFYEKPQVSGPSTGDNTLVIIIGTAPWVQEGGSATFTLDNKYYAVASISSNPLIGLESSTRQIQSKNVVLGKSSARKDATLVDLTTKQGFPVWENTVDSIVAPNGFGLSTDDSFEVPNSKHLHIGIGVEDPSGGNGKIAAALTLAEPSKTYKFTLSGSIYICTGNHEPGQIVDLEHIGGVYKIDIPGEDEEKLVRLKYTKQGRIEPDI